MGNSSRNPQDYDIVRNYRSQQWQLSSANSTPQLWKNRKTHEIAEIFRLYAIPSIQDMNRYEIRSTQQNFVKVFHIALSPNQALCFNQQYVRVLIEFIPIKLENVSGLELEEALTILLSAFKGFNALSNNFGLIEPHQQLIGFNQWGKAKVWLNKQHNNNFPSQASVANHLDKSRIQASHVRKIFDMIQRKTQFGQLPIPLKQLFRVNNPGYVQAVHIVQQFAYQNTLSLQRFIRTDIYVRKPNIYNSNVSNYEQKINYLRGQSNQKVNIRLYNNNQGYQRPQLKRINSVDTLHTQKIMNHSQSAVSFRIPYKQNISNLSGNNFGHHQTRSSIPRIHFQRSNQSGLPFLNQTTFSTKNNTIQVKKLLAKQPIQHVKCVSILSPPTQSPKIEEKPAIIGSFEQQPIAKQQFTSINLKQPEMQEKRQNRDEAQELQQKQNSDQEISCPKIQSNINVLQNQPVVSQGEQTSRSRSIIDKVQSEMSQDLESQNPKYVSNTENVEYQQRDQDIQVSGTFNYKAIYQRNNIQHIIQPLQQIGEQQDFSRQKEEDSKIKDQQEYQNLQSHHQNKDQANNSDQRQKIPINFESFAPVKLIQNQFVSFAPNHTSLPTEQSIQSEQNIQTSKSFQYIQTERIQKKAENIQQLGQIDLNSPEPLVTQIQHKEIGQTIKSEDVRDMARLLEGKKRVSIDLVNAQNTQQPFYTNYTPVQSKFDVVVRRESTISQQSQRHERPSAFAHLDTDEQIQNYVRNKYLGAQKDNFHSKVKVGRVQSQYQKHYVKEPEAYDFTKKEQAKKAFQKEDNRAYLRSKTANNRISNILQRPEQDFLDVNFLQRSLDKRYSANLKSAMKKRQEQDQLNIAKLDEGLMKFSTSKVEKSNKQQKYYDSTQQKVDYKSDYYKWQNSTGFEYQNKPKQNAQLDNIKKKKKSVRIDNIPTQQFVYQLTSCDSNWKKYSKQTNKSPDNQVSVQTIYAKPNSYQEHKPTKASYQKSSLEDRYNKYVKNGNKNEKLPKTPSINQIMSIKGDSRLMLSPIPEKRFEEDARLSYDQLRSFLWG